MRAQCPTFAYGPYCLLNQIESGVYILVSFYIVHSNICIFLLSVLGKGGGGGYIQVVTQLYENDFFTKCYGENNK